MPLLISSNLFINNWRRSISGINIPMLKKGKVKVDAQLAKFHSIKQ